MLPESGSGPLASWTSQSASRPCPCVGLWNDDKFVRRFGQGGLVLEPLVWTKLGREKAKPYGENSNTV
jgi:hypothetical protein